MIVVNKVDLLDAAEADALTERLKSSSRAGVQVVKTSMGALPVDILLGQGIGAESDLEARHEVHHHHHHDDGEDDHHDHAHEHGHDEFESFIVNEVFRLLTYSERSFQLSFVREHEDLEIDLVIERPGLPTYLIEIKSTDRVHEGHLRGLKRIAPAIKGAIPLILSSDPIEQRIDNVVCLPWHIGLKEIGVIGQS